MLLLVRLRCRHIATSIAAGHLHHTGILRRAGFALGGTNRTLGCRTVGGNPFRDHYLLCLALTWLASAPLCFEPVWFASGLAACWSAHLRSS